jgi:hypothetical protein
MQNFTFRNPAKRSGVLGKNSDIDAKAVAKILKLGF